MSQARKSLNTVYLRRGKWVVEYIDFEGKQKVKTLKDENGNYPANKLQAKRFAERILTDIRTMQNLRSEQEFLNRVAERQQLIQRIQFTLDDVLPIIVNNPKLKNGTRLQHRKYQWEKFYNWLRAHYPRVTVPHDVTPLMAQQFANDLYAEGMANSTYNDYITSCRMFFKMIMIHAGLTSNPFTHVERLPKNTISHKPIPREFIPKILAACDDPNFQVLETRRLAPITKAELKTLIVVGLCTGMRLKDCALLDWSCINFENNYIKTVAYKTKKYDKGYLWIPMMPYLRKHLLSIYDWQAVGPIMPNIACRYEDKDHKELLKKSNKLSVSVPMIPDDDSEELNLPEIKSDNGNMSNEVKNLLKFAGLPVSTRLTKAEKANGVTKPIGQRKKSPNLYGFHSFRHYFVSTCAECNIPMAYVEAIIGNESEVIRQYYTHIDTAEMMRSISRIEPKFIGMPTQAALPKPESVIV
mgnify:FL=1